MSSCPIPPPAPPSDSSWWTFTLTWLGRAHLAVVCVFVWGLLSVVLRVCAHTLSIFVLMWVCLCSYASDHCQLLFWRLTHLKASFAFRCEAHPFLHTLKPFCKITFLFLMIRLFYVGITGLKKGKKARIHKRNALIKLRQYWWLLQAAEL